MMQPSSSTLPSIADLLSKGKQAALTGQRELAREMLAYVVYLDPRNAEGWLWLSGVVDFPQHVLASEDDLSPRFVTGVALHNLIGAIKRVTGEPGATAMLTMAHLEEHAEVTPPAEETPAANFTSFSALSEAMEEFYDHAVVA